MKRKERKRKERKRQDKARKERKRQGKAAKSHNMTKLKTPTQSRKTRSLYLGKQNTAKPR
jgi:hypothetical protein